MISFNDKYNFSYPAAAAAEVYSLCVTLDVSPWGGFNNMLVN